MNTRTNRQTDTHTDKSTFRKHRPRGPMLWKDRLSQKCKVINILYCVSACNAMQSEMVWIGSFCPMEIFLRITKLRGLFFIIQYFGDISHVFLNITMCLLITNNGTKYKKRVIFLLKKLEVWMHSRPQFFFYNLIWTLY